MSGQPKYLGEPQARDEALYFARQLGVIAERPPKLPHHAKLHDWLVAMNPGPVGLILQHEEINDWNKILEFIRFELAHCATSPTLDLGLFKYASVP